MPTLATRTCTHADHRGPATLPETTDNFYRNPRGRWNVWCRECMRRDQAARRLNGPRRPRARKFGVEIECIVDRNVLDRELRRRGLAVYNANYTHQVMSSWKIVTDASVYNGFELVSPPLSGARGLDQLRRACEALDAAGATVNRSCGLHVHHDVNDLDTRAFGRLFRTWAANQAHTDALVAPSRRGNRWAAPLREDEVRRAEQLPSMERTAVRSHFAYVDRYRTLNVAAFPRYGTVEVRQHQGTINYSKIAAWIAYGQAFIKLAKDNGDVTTAANVDALIDRLAGHGLTADQATFLKGRAAHFTRGRVAA